MTSHTDLAAQARKLAFELSDGSAEPVADLLRQLADALESKGEPVAVVLDNNLSWTRHGVEVGAPDGTLLYAAPVQPEKDERKPGICTWTYEDDPTYAWNTGCGNLWAFTDGDPEDNGTKFCPYCGGAVGIKSEGGHA